MKNLQELNNQELKQIEGGDWIAKIGGAVHKGWCKVKGAMKDFSENAAKRDIDRPYIW